MKQKLAFFPDVCLTHLSRLGETIHARRKALGVNATNTAESAGISRVTLHRIEKGEASVSMGAYMNVMSSLGINLVTAETIDQAKENSSIPVKVMISDYPGLKQLAWHVRGTNTLTPIEARDIYERNWRHLEPNNINTKERNLINALKEGLGGNFPLLSIPHKDTL